MTKPDEKLGLTAVLSPPYSEVGWAFLMPCPSQVVREFRVGPQRRDGI
jgi:hypothetical protein